MLVSMAAGRSTVVMTQHLNAATVQHLSPFIITITMTNTIQTDWIRMLPPESKQWTTPQSKLDALDLVSVPLPTPDKGQVLVKIHAVSLNYRDVQVCTGKYEHTSTLLPPRLGILAAADKPAPEKNLVPCSDMCGTVILSQDSKIKQGTRVIALFHQSFLDGAMDEHDAESTLGYPLHGVLAQYKVFPATSVVPVPKYLSSQEASCLPLAALAAWSSLTSTPSSTKSTLLQSTSPVSIAGLQLAKTLGLQTVVTAPSENHVKQAQELGADTVINHQTHWEWQDAVLDATDKKGVDVVLETGSTRTLRKSFACVAFGGQIHAVGNSASTEDDGDDGDGEKGKAKTPQLHRMNVGGLALKRNVTLRAVLGGKRKQMLDMLAFYEKHKIKPVVDKVFKFEEAKEALEYVAKGEGFGKVVITLEENEKKEE